MLLGATSDVGFRDFSLPPTGQSVFHLPIQTRAVPVRSKRDACRVGGGLFRPSNPCMAPSWSCTQPRRRGVFGNGSRGRGLSAWTCTVDGRRGQRWGRRDRVRAQRHSSSARCQRLRRAGRNRAQWQKHVIDTGGVATEDLVVADLTGDGHPDIVAGGRATHNVKLYVQVR